MKTCVLFSFTGAIESVNVVSLPSPVMLSMFKLEPDTAAATVYTTSLRVLAGATLMVNVVVPLAVAIEYAPCSWNAPSTKTIKLFSDAVVWLKANAVVEPLQVNTSCVKVLVLLPPPPIDPHASV